MFVQSFSPQGRYFTFLLLKVGLIQMSCRIDITQFNNKCYWPSKHEAFVHICMLHSDICQQEIGVFVVLVKIIKFSISVLSSLSLKRELWSKICINDGYITQLMKKG